MKVFPIALLVLSTISIHSASAVDVQAIDSDKLEDLLAKDKSVWLVRFSSEKLDDFESTWADLAKVVKKAKKGEVDASSNANGSRSPWVPDGGARSGEIAISSARARRRRAITPT